MRHKDATFDDAFAALDILNGSAGVRAVMADRSFDPVKFGSEPLGRYEALRNKLGDELTDSLLGDEVELVFQEPSSILVRKKDLPPLDDDGRFIFRKIKASITNANWDYGFDKSLQPSYEENLSAFEDSFQRKGYISVSEFRDRAEAKKLEMLNGPFAKLFTGTQVRPFALAIPSVNILNGKLGEALAEIFVPAAKRGYQRQFPKRPFNDYRGDSLRGNVESFDGSHQEMLFEALRKGSVVLWVFLNCLQGGSINADRKVVERLPESIILNGTIQVASVFAGYPAVVAASGKNPLYFCAADVWQSGYSLYLLPSDSSATFHVWDVLGSCDGYSSGGVSVLA